MDTPFSDGARSVLARAVSAEVRAAMAASRVSGKALAAQVGVSQNYLATRLRDEKPFTLDDIEEIVYRLFDDRLSAESFVERAMRAHSSRIWDEVEAARTGPDRDAAHDDVEGNETPALVIAGRFTPVDDASEFAHDAVAHRPGRSVFEDQELRGE